MYHGKNMSKLNPRVDFAFKILFGSEENTDILLPFINSVLSMPHPITEIKLLNPYNHKTHSTDKFSILDIKAKDETGKLYNIEMQVADEVDYDQRALYYWSKLYSQQLKEGDGFKCLKKTISIHILNFNHFDEKEYHNIFHVLNTKTHKRAFEDLELHFIELKKFDKDINHLTTALDRWVTFLSKAERWEKGKVPQALKNDPAIQKAAAALDRLSLDEQEREIYEARLKWLRTEAGAIEMMRQKSLEKGREEGRAEGEVIGINKGRAEEREEIALRLIKKGTMSLEEIADISGLSVDEVRMLQEHSTK